MVIREVVVFCEDTYGPEFFRNLVNRLEKEKIVGDVKIVGETFRVCWKKTTRQLTASTDGYDAVLLVVDAEGEDKKKKRAHLMKHVPADQKTKVHTIIFDIMIEEWVCLGLGIKHGSRPSEDLSNWKRDKEGAAQKYQKRQLPGFVAQMDLSKLKNDRSFKILLKVLKG